jgi:hypothetical protein
VVYAVGSHAGFEMALRSAHDVASWLDELETFTATMTVIHHGAATMMDALHAAMSGNGGTPKAVTIKSVYVFDVTQTQERTQRAAALRGARWPGTDRG